MSTAIQRTEDRGQRSVEPWVLRALVANDEALIEHYAQWAEQLEPEPIPAALLGSLGDTIRRLQLRRMALENLTAPQPLCTTHER